MDTIIALILILDAYAIVFFRLMCSYHFQRINDVKESPLGAIFSFPPHRQLNEAGRGYSKKYWIALGIMVAVVAYLAITRDYSQLGITPSAGES